jgi:L-fuconolactonase
MNSALRVDAHAHVLSPRLRSLGLMPSGVRVPATGGGAEHFLGLLRHHGVGGAIVVGVLGDDAYLWDAFDGTDDVRIWRVLAVEERPSAEAVTRTMDALSRPGVVGVRLRRLGPPDELRPDALPVFPILRALAVSGQALWILMAAEQHRLLLRVLDRLPALVGVLNHMGAVPAVPGGSVGGRPQLALPAHRRRQELTELAAHPEMRVVLSGQYSLSHNVYPYDDLRPHGEFLLRKFGPNRLLWGSDYPLVGTVAEYGNQLAWVRKTLVGLSDREVAAILGGNAWKLGSQCSPGMVGNLLGKERDPWT